MLFVSAVWVSLNTLGIVTLPEGETNRVDVVAKVVDVTSADASRVAIVQGTAHVFAMHILVVRNRESYAKLQSAHCRGHHRALLLGLPSDLLHFLLDLVQRRIHEVCRWF